MAEIPRLRRESLVALQALVRGGLCTWNGASMRALLRRGLVSETQASFAATDAGRAVLDAYEYGLIDGHLNRGAGADMIVSRAGRERCESEIRRIAQRRVRAQRRFAADAVEEALDPAWCLDRCCCELDRDDYDQSNPYHDHVELPVYTLLEVARQV